MKAKPLTQHYHLLTPQERFRLILAASGRDDDVERDRLVRTGKRITVSRQDHAPYAYAFHEVALLTFLMVLEDTSRYFDALAMPEYSSMTMWRITEPTSRRLVLKRIMPMNPQRKRRAKSMRMARRKLSVAKNPFRRTMPAARSGGDASV